MRFCPFCAAENPDDASHCSACARRLPTTGGSGAVRVAQEKSAPVPVAAPAPAPRAASLPPPGPVKAAPLPPPPVKVTPPTTPTVPPPPRQTEPPVPTPTPSNGVPVAPAAVVPSGGVVKEPTKSTTLEPTRDEKLKISAIPDVPESGVLTYARYFLLFLRARWDRGRAMKSLTSEITTYVATLDGLLGSLGRLARDKKVDLRPLSEENQQIDGAVTRREAATRAITELGLRLAEENVKSDAVEKELAAKLETCEQAARQAAQELDKLEGERRDLRERKKEVEKQQKARLKQAEDREAHAAKSQLGDERQALRKSADELRREAKRLDPERLDLEQKLATLEAPHKEATALHETTRADVENTAKALDDARAGRRHRVAELEDQKAIKAREITQSDSEIGRRLVTLGTLLNLNRVDGADFAPLYHRIDALRGSIGENEHEIERLSTERGQLDKGALVRGAAVLGIAVVMLITMVCVIVALAQR